MIYEVIVNGDKPRTFKVELRRTPAEGGAAASAPANSWECRIDGQTFHLDATMGEREALSLLLDGRSYEARRDSGTGEIVLHSRRFPVEVCDPRSLRSRRRSAAGTEGPKKLTAPMPGKVVRLLVKEGDTVEAGQGVIVIEAMKMQNELKSPKKGVVKRLNVAEGATVNAGDALAVVE